MKRSTPKERLAFQKKKLEESKKLLQGANEEFEAMRAFCRENAPDLLHLIPEIDWLSPDLDLSNYEPYRLKMVEFHKQLLERFSSTAN